MGRHRSGPQRKPAPEIAAKCWMLRTRPGRQGAYTRAPRGSEFAVETTAGI